MRLTVPLVLVVVLAGCNDEIPSAPSTASPTPTAAATPAPTPTATPAANGPPVLGLRIVPNPPSGSAPLFVKVNMCTTSDPDADPILFEFKFGGGVDRFSALCRDEYTYQKRGRYAAFFCASDPPHGHVVCQNFLIVVS
jgi:hypothetical protein